MGFNVKFDTPYHYMTYPLTNCDIYPSDLYVCYKVLFNSPVSVDARSVEEVGGVLLPGVDVDDVVRPVVGVTGVALDVVRQPVHGSALCEQVVKVGRKVVVPRHDGLNKLSKGGHRFAV